MPDAEESALATTAYQLHGACAVGEEMEASTATLLCEG